MIEEYTHPDGHKILFKLKYKNGVLYNICPVTAEYDEVCPSLNKQFNDLITEVEQILLGDVYEIRDF